MPPYAHLRERRVDFTRTADKLRAMRAVGVPYKPEEVQSAGREAARAGQLIAAGLAHDGGAQVAPDSELVALISYLQRLGRSTSPIPQAPAAGNPVVASKGGN
jgi:cytochrome c oxidase cbb3-type subunit I/II